MVRSLKCTRREALLALSGAGWMSLWASVGAVLPPSPSHAMGRIPFGGSLRLALPWRLERIDPHATDDALAAFFGHALFDSLFDQASDGRSYPALAAAMPQKTTDGVGLRLRPSLVTASGKRLNGRDLEFSLRRAINTGARPLLREFGIPRRSKREAGVVVFPKGSAEAIASALSSPLTAIVPRGFDPKKPDGTGAFGAKLERGKLTLRRNLRAGRGASFLDGVVVEEATDLADALRRFESKRVDVGWLGRGLHRPRAGTKLFRGPDLGWFLLHTGKRLGRWGVAGMAERLLQGIDARNLERFGVQRPPNTAPHVKYGGPSCDLLVRSDSVHLVELAETLAQTLSQAGSEIRVRKQDPSTVQRTIRGGDFHFALAVTRAFGWTAKQRQLSLLAASDPNLTRNPPRVPESASGRSVDLLTTRATRIGIVGSLEVVAARTEEFLGLEAWDLGRVWTRV